MNYISTREGTAKKSASEVILEGISPEGGLYVPESFPVLSRELLSHLCGLDYCGRAREILKRYLTDFTDSEIMAAVESAYTGGKFQGDLPAPLSKVGDAYLLELWHGPTCAFKDMALQLLPHLLSTSGKKQGSEEDIVILVATSGDTGKAALEGFKDAEGTSVLVFYPQEGVSAVQKLQMQTQEGSNVAVAGIRGNFDDAQSAVKEMFTSPALGAALKAKGLRFSSANSINFGRLLPQIVYYISAYCDLVEGEELAMGDPINVVVPTGNFGNILAAYYAKQMGLPIRRLICASNQNNVLADFMDTGVYDRSRPFLPSYSPSMDILISSNLERLLFELCERDAAATAALMKALSEEGRYALTESQRQRLTADFAGDYLDDAGTLSVIASVFSRYGYLVDPHTAVAFGVYERYLKKSGDDTKTVVVSTASPFKFSDSVCKALALTYGEGTLAPTEALAAAAGLEPPQAILTLANKPVRFSQVLERGGLEEFVKGSLSL